MSIHWEIHGSVGHLTLDRPEKAHAYTKVDPKRASIQTVVIVPTRELGLQVTGVLKQLSSKKDDILMDVLQKLRREMEQRMKAVEAYWHLFKELTILKPNLIVHPLKTR